MQTELNKVITALHEFYAREAFLLEKEAGERALTHRLAVQLEKQFPGWEIDCEYDRLGDRTLRLPHGTIVSTDDHLAKSIYPDIVVHQRAIPNNLLAVEVRTSANHQPIEHAHPKIVKMLDDIKADDERAFAEQKRITEIPAPPFKEKLRAEYYQKRMQELGFKDAAIDGEGNVIALRKGSGGGRPRLVVSAHLDTVFPEGTDVTAKEKDGAIVAPGIGDDSRGLAALLSLIKAMNENQIATVGDIMFVGTVGEEELGNLRGVKALFRDHADIDGFISIDGLGVSRVVNQATGSHRYEMIFKGPGGHSFQEFGLPSAVHALGRAVAKIADLQTPI